MFDTETDQELGIYIPDKNDFMEIIQEEFEDEMQCSKCKNITYLHRVFFDEFEETVTARYTCKCGYTQGIQLWKEWFIIWFKKELKKQNLDEIIIKERKDL